MRHLPQRAKGWMISITARAGNTRISLWIQRARTLAGDWTQMREGRPGLRPGPLATPLVWCEETREAQPLLLPGAAGLPFRDLHQVADLHVIQLLRQVLPMGNAQEVAGSRLTRLAPRQLILRFHHAAPADRVAVETDHAARIRVVDLPNISEHTEI